MKIYLCRHGETQWSKSGQHTGLTDIPLTEEGKEQARLLGKALREIEFKEIYSSPLNRAIGTCELAGFSTPTVDTDLVEWNYGDYEGITTPKIWEADPGWNIFDRGAPNGESEDEVAVRADRFLELVNEKEGAAAVFSHGHFSRVLAARWIGQPARFGKFLKLSTASICILGQERKRPAIELWNSTSHLSE